MRRKLLTLSILLGMFVAGLASGGMAQRDRGPFPGSRMGDGAPPDGLPSKGPSRQLKMVKESFEQTKKDTAELYDLAAQLKDEVDKADENTLSVTVVNKAESIEKLAEKIKNRMKNL